MLKNVTNHGVGIGFRGELHQQIIANPDKIDCVEIVAEHYIHKPNALPKLKALADKFKLVPHGVNLSIASSSPNTQYLQAIKEICKIAQSEYYTDHLSLTKAPGIASSHLAPVWLSENMLKNVISNIKIAQDFIGLPLLLENISYDFTIGINTIPTEAFLSEIVKETGCGILLDVANLHINSHNHNFNPYHFIDKLPTGAIVQTHIAGGIHANSGKLIDSHSHDVSSNTFKLLEYVSRKTQLKCVILERDSNYPDNFESLLADMSKARTIAFGNALNG